MYKNSEPGSVLRKFAADSVACNNSLKKHAPTSASYKKWKLFVDRCPELGLDIAEADKKRDWEGTFAWDDQ